MASLRAPLPVDEGAGLRSELLGVGSWSALRHHDQPRGLTKQGNRLSESRSAKTGKRETWFRPVPASIRCLGPSDGSKVKGSGPFSCSGAAGAEASGLGALEKPDRGQPLPTIRWLAECKVP